MQYLKYWRGMRKMESVVDNKPKKEKEIVAEMHKREQPDSFTLGTPKEGAYKCYFNLDEEMKKDTKDTKAYKLLQLKKGIDGL